MASQDKNGLTKNQTKEKRVVLWGVDPVANRTGK